jgi:hypothetical protein
MPRTAMEAAEAALPGWRVKQAPDAPAPAVEADTGGESLQELNAMYGASAYSAEGGLSFQAAGSTADHGPMEVVVMEPVDPGASFARSKLVLVVDGEVVAIQD